jgi:hypothetical protein
MLLNDLVNDHPELISLMDHYNDILLRTGVRELPDNEKEFILLMLISAYLKGSMKSLNEAKEAIRPVMEKYGHQETTPSI